MKNWIRKYAEARCGTKRAFRKPAKADEAAMKASLKTGELIISYQCYDCERWHIGHADETQVLARRQALNPLCIICGKEISEIRRTRARSSGNTTDVCSSHCAHQKKRRAKQERRAARQQLEEFKSEGSE